MTRQLDCTKEVGRSAASATPGPSGGASPPGAAPSSAVAAPRLAAPRDRSATAKADEAQLLLGRGEADKAEALAMGTLNACEDRCSAAVKARLWCLVGIAWSRRNEVDRAREAFTSAIEVDPGVKPDTAVAGDQAMATFYEARARRGQ
ncbi:MAG: hypothetical protein JW751_12945 [Polyangiaceae bacterium]|nr:hypothetical protein [Polyangiaceae bacterium]